MTHSEFTIRSGKHAGVVLGLGSWFRLGRLPGSIFHFLHYHVHPKGGEWVSAYGGDPSPSARRQNRAFHVDEEFVPARAPTRK